MRWSLPAPLQRTAGLRLRPGTAADAHGARASPACSMGPTRATPTVRHVPAPQIYGSLIKWLHYNEQGDHFVAVYGSHNAQVVGIDLSINEAGLVETEQLSILGSAWAERRQELITAGGDGTLRFSALRTEYQITTHGRRLTSRMVPRMTICSGFLWYCQVRFASACDGSPCMADPRFAASSAALLPKA